MKNINTAPAEAPAKLRDILKKECTCALRIYHEYSYELPCKEFRNAANEPALSDTEKALTRITPWLEVKV